MTVTLEWERVGRGYAIGTARLESGEHAGTIHVSRTAGRWHASFVAPRDTLPWPVAMRPTLTRKRAMLAVSEMLNRGEPLRWSEGAYR